MSDLPGGFPAAHAAHPHGHSCSAEPVGRRRLNGIAATHTVALALQGLLIARFLDLDAETSGALVLGFGVLGAGLALVWRRWTAIPHALDMCFGMCTLGALGMYLGVWTDHRFAPMPALDSLLWTYGFMLVACNAAMFLLTRHRHALNVSDPAFLAMFIGGNLGMIAGMKAGGMAVGLLVHADRPTELVCKLAGMSLGMAVGMLLGDWLARVLSRRIPAARR
jgi:hypothetical protein